MESYSSFLAAFSRTAAESVGIEFDGIDNESLTDILVPLDLLKREAPGAIAPTLESPEERELCKTGAEAQLLN